MKSKLSKKWDKEEDNLNKGYVLINPLKKPWLKYIIIAIIILIILYLIF